MNLAALFYPVFYPGKKHFAPFYDLVRIKADKAR